MTNTTTSYFVSRLQSFPITMTCGHVVNRLMRRAPTCTAQDVCEVCRGEMTQEQFNAFQDSVRKYG